MNTRIKMIRKDKKITQQKMADDLLVGKSTIEKYEYGTLNLTDRTIADICRLYGVNETWLRTGEGDMYAPASREQRIAQLVAKLFSEETNPHMINIINVVTQMSDEQIELLIDVAKKLAQEEEE